MAPKRHFSLETGGGDESPTRAGGSKRRCCRRHGQGCSLLEFMEMLDPSDFQMVQQIYQKHRTNVPHLSSSCRARIYRLQFRNKLPDTLFTERIFKAENNMKVEIVMVDASNKVIRFGPMATADIEIVVLDGDFRGDENGEWTEEEFAKHVIVARKDKRPLLIGNLPIKLCDGVGHISDAKFTDNSSWTKSKKFRLGVKLYGGIGMAEEVQEGISNAFRVKDRHGESNQKDRPPLMNDEVCCLKGIFKNGSFHKKLVECKINTVRDFLCYCSNNHPETLRAMIGMPKRAWEKTYGHASESKGRSDILLNGPVNLPAPDQNSFEVTGLSSSQISNFLVQPNDVQRLPSNAECGLPISGMSAGAQSLPAPKFGFERRNSFKTIFITREGAWKGTEQLDMSWEVLMEGNGSSYVPNKFDIGSLSLRHKWLKLLFVARLKVAALRSRESKYSETSSPRHNWLKLLFVARLKVAALRSRESKYTDDLSCLYGSEPQWEDFSPISLDGDGWYDMKY